MVASHFGQFYLLYRLLHIALLSFQFSVLSTQSKTHFNLLERYVSKSLQYLLVVQTQIHFLLTFVLKKLLIFASISSLKTLILLKVLQSHNLNNWYVWLQRRLILYLTVYFTNTLMVQQWSHLLDHPLQTHFCHTIKKTG